MVRPQIKFLLTGISAILLFGCGGGSGETNNAATTSDGQTETTDGLADNVESLATTDLQGVWVSECHEYEDNYAIDTLTFETNQWTYHTDWYSDSSCDNPLGDSTSSIAGFTTGGTVIAESGHTAIELNTDAIFNLSVVHYSDIYYLDGETLYLGLSQTSGEERETELDFDFPFSFVSAIEQEETIDIDSLVGEWASVCYPYDGSYYEDLVVISESIIQFNSQKYSNSACSGFGLEESGLPFTYVTGAEVSQPAGYPTAYELDMKTSSQGEVFDLAELIALDGDTLYFGLSTDFGGSRPEVIERDFSLTRL